MKVLFFGSDQFSWTCLHSFQEHVSSQHHIDVLACSHSLLAKHPACSIKITGKSLQNLNIEDDYEYGAVASFGLFIPKRIIRSFKRGILNVHPSLLPKYRGPSPIQYSIMNRDLISGVSIINVHPAIFDAGDVHLHEKIDIQAQDTFSSLSNKLALLGGVLLARAISEDCKPSPQDSDRVTHTSKITRKTGLLNFQRQDAHDIEALFRAIHHQEHLHIVFSGATIVFLEIKIPKDAPLNYEPERWETLICAPGTVFYEKPTRSLWTKCRDGWISCSKFHMSTSPTCYHGGQIMSALHFRSLTGNFCS